MRYLPESLYRAAVAVFLALPLSLSCQKISDAPLQPYEEEKVTFGVMEEDIMDTKSLLTASNIETKKTSITVAAYTGGKLFSTKYIGSYSSSFTLDLRKSTNFHLYAFVNMGDLSSSIPTNESSISSVTYTIPSYTSGTTSVATRGIPMAGYLDVTLGTSASGTTYIPVKRLLAKVTATLSLGYSGKITSAHVCNMNGRLTPFGGVLTDGQSKATASSHMLSFEEVHGTSLGTSSTMTATFYVPENMQGTFSSITSSANKKIGNSVINGVAPYLTYLEVSVVGQNDVSGTMTYRSLLGSNATSDFNIARNACYNWTITYNRNGTTYDDWKHENDLMMTEYYLEMSPGSATLDVGNTKNFDVDRYYRWYYPASGITEEEDYDEGMDDSDFTWTTGSSSIATVNSSGVVTAVAGGTTYVRATLKSTVSDYDLYTVKYIDAPITVNTYTYQLVITDPAGTSTTNRAQLQVGYSKTLEIYLYKKSGNTVVQSTKLNNTSVTWTVPTGASRATVSSAGVVTGTLSGSVTIRASYSSSASGSLTTDCYFNIVGSGSGGGGMSDDWD